MKPPLSSWRSVCAYKRLVWAIMIDNCFEYYCPNNEQEEVLEMISN